MLAASILAMVLAGCDQPPTRAGGGGVAVVDFQKLAEASGKGREIQGKMMAASSKARAAVEADPKFKEKMDAMKAAEAEAKATPGKDADAKVAAARQELQKVGYETAAAMGINQGLQQMESQLMGDLRAEVAKVAMGVAMEHGMSVVLMNSDIVLDCTKDADITQLVVDEMAKTSSSNFGGGFGGPPAPGVSGGPGGSGMPGIPPGPGAGPGGGAPPVSMPQTTKPAQPKFSDTPLAPTEPAAK
jgi:Skp family chaperone for outer membrane proteins